MKKRKSSPVLIALLLWLSQPLIAVGADEHQPTDTAMANRPVVILGASYAAGLTLDHLAGHPVINKGIGGQQSAEMLARFDTDVIAQQPRGVIIWGFINDIFRSDPDQMATTLEKTRSNFIEIVDRAQQHDIVPILATEITMSRHPGLTATLRHWLGALTGKASYQDFINQHVVATNVWLKRYAGEHDILLIDLQTLLGGGPGVMRDPAYALEDASHISPAGYRVIADHLRDHLQILPDSHEASQEISP